MFASSDPLLRFLPIRSLYYEHKIRTLALCFMQKKPKISRYRHYRLAPKHTKWLKVLWGAGLLFVLVVFMWNNWKLWKARQTITEKVQDLSNALSQKDGNNSVGSAYLQNNIGIKDSEFYFEQIAREILNLKKEGETVVAFPEQSDFRSSPLSAKIRDLWQEFLEMRKKEKEKTKN